MAVSRSRLRRWFAFAAISVCLIVAAVYFNARRGVENALTQVPEKMGVEIQQSAQGFTISKSEQGRTLFKLQAGKAVQFKEHGHAELHDVTITIYGRDSSRFDQVYGKDFDYDQQSGDVTGKGEVSIDLQSNPQGASDPDQAAPKELKNPIHLKTTNLVFNQKTGDAWTPALVEFRVPQASGSAVGANYVAKDSILTLKSQVRIVTNGDTPSIILAQQAILEKSPRQIVLRYPQAQSPEQQGQADAATLFLRQDDTLDHALATGNVRLQSARKRVTSKPDPTRARSGAVEAAGKTWLRVSSQNLQVQMKKDSGLDTAVFSGDVHFSTEGPQPAESSAGRAVLSFADGNALTKIHADEWVNLLQHQSSGANAKQDVEVSAPAMDFLVADGNRLTRAETIGPPQIAFLPVARAAKPEQQTRVTAGRFIAKFDPLGQLSSVHGEPNARVITTLAPQNDAPQPDRVSSSDIIDAWFRPGTGIEALIQQGHFAYSSGTQHAFADRARYTPADQIAVLNGSPRILDAGMATTARVVRLNRATGDGFAEGDVKTTYSDLKPQPNGALLASSDPVHVTSESMVAHNNAAIASYTGNVRLWQNANVVEAPSIEFHKEQRTVIADSNSNQKVSTVLIGMDKSGKATPVHVTANHLVYSDSERKAHYEGEVTVQGPDMTVTSDTMDVFFAPAAMGSLKGAAPAAPQPATTKLDKIIAAGSVLVTQPNRRGAGDRLVYTAPDDKFVLTGGPPSIFDAEHGRVTGVSLTLFRHDDRVIVEGDSSSPAVTQTRVVR